MKKFKKFILSFLLFLIVHCTLKIEDCVCQWIQQTLPISAEASSLVFFDINTGVISVAQGYTRYILRTTNSGFNWNIVNSVTGAGIATFQKIDSTTIYAGGGNNGYLAIYRTFDRGLTWDSVSRSNSLAYASIYFVNKDTGFVSVYDWTNNRIWRTINGGVTLTPYSNPSALLYGRLFFLKEKVNGEYCGWLAGDAIMKTTNSGLYWSNISGMQATSYSKIYFTNKDTGWVSGVGINGNMVVTFNGGFNWIIQPMPSIEYSGIADFVYAGNGILFGTGGGILINNNAYGVIWKTTNYGNNWGFQLPDTSFHFSGITISNLDSLNIWSYQFRGIKTTNGGGSIIYTNIYTNENKISDNFSLKQNYPNPFNSSTIIEFYIKKKSIVYLTIYNIEGKEIFKLYNGQFLIPGNYLNTINFETQKIPSGIYFYTLKSGESNLSQKTMKMIYIK
jgi:hypothetical protein